MAAISVYKNFSFGKLQMLRPKNGNLKRTLISISNSMRRSAAPIMSIKTTEIKRAGSWCAILWMPLHIVSSAARVGIFFLQAEFCAQKSSWCARRRLDSGRAACKTQDIFYNSHNLGLKPSLAKSSADSLIQNGKQDFFCSSPPAAPKMGRTQASPVTIIKRRIVLRNLKLVRTCWNASLTPFQFCNSFTFCPAWDTYISRGSKPSLLMCTVRSAKFSNSATALDTASKDVRNAFGLVTRPPSRTTVDRFCMISQLANTWMIAIRYCG